MTKVLRCAWFLALALPAGCGSEPMSAVDTGHDGSVAHDGSAGTDLGTGTDLGAATDLGAGTDLGAATDLGAGTDLGTDLGAAVDAGAPDLGHDAGPPPSRDVRCGDPRPTGAPTPPALPSYSGGTCPTLAPGHNDLVTAGGTRNFILVTPTTIAPGEQLPILFMWHWLGGSADGFLTQGNVQAAADAMRFIAVIPEKKGDVVITIPFVRTIDMVWPYLTSSTTARVNEELTFFDDMLACVSAQYSVDQDCVSSVGVSAGALWTSQLMQHRSDRLASAIVLSGGVGPASGTTLLDVEGWAPAPAPRPLPTLVLWGGPTDTCAINFQTASHNLEADLVANGSFVLECIHNCGHGVPPVADPTLGVAALYRFAFDHPYWLSAGESPYYVRGLPAGMPDWCSIGAGAATPRTGTCDPAACSTPALP